MYIYLKVCKQMTDVKLLVLHTNTLNHLKNKQTQVCLKMLSKNGVYKSYMFTICV